MNTTIFLVNRWVKFSLNNEICVGRTFETVISKKMTSRKQIFYITDSRNSKIINFEFCNEIKYLTFIANPFEIDKYKTLNNYISSAENNGNSICIKTNSLIISKLIKNQLNSLSLN